MTEDDAAERPRKESDSIGGEGSHCSHQRVNGGEEYLVEDQRGGSAIDEEVIPFYCGSHHAGEACNDVAA
ncbi:hypothetical protein D3C72_2090970 [compost metagenome]